jgi:hypothetical protein
MGRYDDIDPQDIDPDTGAPYPGYSSPALDTSFHDHEMDVDDDGPDLWHVTEADAGPWTIRDGSGLRVATAYTIEAANQIVADHNRGEGTETIWLDASACLTCGRDCSPAEIARDECERCKDQSEGNYPPACTNRSGHSWPNVDESERCLCEYCGADGDA